MTDEVFLSRWVRLKAGRPVHGASRNDECCDQRPQVADRVETGSEDLPPLETLGPDSDYRAFLKSGVDEALRRSALRRAWETDDAIAGFRGMAEYDWDFNAPGYGALRAADVLDALRPPADAPSTEQTRTEPVAVEPCRDGALNAATEDGPAAVTPVADVPFAASPEAEPSEPAVSLSASAAKRHGGALPD